MNESLLFSHRDVKEQLLLEEVSSLKNRCTALEFALANYIKEAHFSCLDGIDECDHLAGVCYCTYHKALDRAQSLLRKR